MVVEVDEVVKTEVVDKMVGSTEERYAFGSRYIK